MATGRIPTTANSPLTAKGDLFTFSTGSAKLAVGNNGETLVANSSTSTGLAYIPLNSAGKNGIINGGFDIWQRGTSISYTSGQPYTADRWSTTTAGAATTISRQTSGLTGIQYSARYQRNAGQTNTGVMYLANGFESSESYKYAGKEVTISFWAKIGANFSGASNQIIATLYTGTGTDQNLLATGFTGEATPISQTPTLTTSFQRFSYTGTVSSSATQVGFLFGYSGTGTAGANDWFEVTGVQLELGSTATTFSRAGGTIQGELAACQRYYWRNRTGSLGTSYGSGFNADTVSARIYVKWPSTMRTTPTSVDYSTLAVTDYATITTGVSSITFVDSNDLGGTVVATVASGLTQFRGAFLVNQSSASGYLGFSAEL